MLKFICFFFHFTDDTFRCHLFDFNVFFLKSCIFNGLKKKKKKIGNKRNEIKLHCSFFFFFFLKIITKNLVENKKILLFENFGKKKKKKWREEK